MVAIAGPIAEIKGDLPKRKSITLHEERVHHILGIKLELSKITEILQRLQFDFSVKNTTFDVTTTNISF